MKAVRVELPDSIELSEKDIKMMVGGHMYEQGQLSLGQAADLVGVSKKEFIETMGEYGFSLFSSSVADLRRDIDHA